MNHKGVDMVEKKKPAEKKPEVKTSEKTAPKTVETKKEVTAKAGKRSAKAIAETEIKLAKEKAKTSKSSKEITTPAVSKTPRSRAERRGKKYKKVYELVDKSKDYKIPEALTLAVQTSTTKFDSSVELHINLGVDPKQAEQNVRDTVTLPAGTGKTINIAVFCEADDAKNAKSAGADKAGNEDLLAEIDKGKIDFDVLITTPQMMSKLAKYARVLGPKGLMPNPKSGTVTTDIAKAVKQAKAGQVEYRVDSTGIIHLAVGKVSFGAEKLEQNTRAVISSIKAAKPAGLKSNYFLSAYITTTMGPSIKLLLSDI